MDEMKNSFAGLGLSQALIEAIENMGYLEPTPIQEKAIPLVLNHKAHRE